MPERLDRQSAYIERILRSSEHKSVQGILRKYDKKRELIFRSSNYRDLKEVNLDNPTARIAAAVQSRGEEVDNPCERCIRNEGPFVLCVHLQDEQDGRCGCCIYLKEPKCTIANSK